MTYATIGAGTVAQGIAAHLVRAGHDVILSNSRGPDTLTDVVAALGPHAHAGTVAQVAAADMVFLAVRWPDVPDALAGLADWGGRILVDTINPFRLVDGQFEVLDLNDPTGSEIVARLAPGARVVKAFNTLYGKYIAADPRQPAGRRVLFYAGDDPDAKTTFAATVEGLGYAPVDVGALASGGRLMSAAGGPLAALHALQDA